VIKVVWYDKLWLFMYVFAVLFIKKKIKIYRKRIINYINFFKTNGHYNSWAILAQQISTRVIICEIISVYYI